jgi:5-methylcytosine-specific restriction endonuclease McrA
MTLKTELRDQLYARDGRTCHYCGIEENDFLKIWGEFYGGKKRGGTLEVDRKDNVRGYEIDNCVLACAVCNNAKSDKFTYEEFRRVGDVIGKIWQERKDRII